MKTSEQIESHGTRLAREWFGCEKGYLHLDAQTLARRIDNLIGELLHERNVEPLLTQLKEARAERDELLTRQGDRNEDQRTD